jgi:hypothetical protein
MKAYSQFLKGLPSKSAVFTFGSFQPPTIDHELLIKTVEQVAEQQNSTKIIYTSSLQDDKKNPLPADRKVYYLNRMFPESKFKTASNLLEAVAELNEKYNSIVLVVGSDQVADCQKLLEKHNGKEFNFNSIKVVSTGERNADEDTTVNKLRESAKKGDYELFKENLPNTITSVDAKRLMNEMRTGFGLEIIKEQVKLATDWLRESYFRGELFNVGDIVESDNTVYRIQKRGSNHLLLQNEQGDLISKWIRDVIISQKPFNYQGIVSEMKFTATDKIKVARIIANALGVTDVEKTSSAEQLINNALRKVRNKPMRPEYIAIIHNMLQTAREAGIEYDQKLVPSKVDIKEQNDDEVNPIGSSSEMNRPSYWSDKVKKIKEKHQQDKINSTQETKKIEEVSSELLDRYKDKAKKSADDLASKGNYKKSTDRWMGVMKATGKQIDKTTSGIKKALNKEEYEQILEAIDEALTAVDKGEYDYEGQMARTQLQTTLRNAKDLIDMIKDNDNMPEWVQSKITLAQDYITTVRDYLQSKQELGEAKNPCWSGYKMLGMKKKGNKEVPNCIPEEAEQIDEISQKLAGNYYGAATKKHIDKVGVKPNMYGRIEKDMGKQRKAGVDRALDRVTGARKTNEEVDISEDIKKEYDSLKKNHDIKSLRGLIQTQHKIIDTSEFKTKDHAISHYLRTKHGNKKVAAAFGLKEDFETIEEHIEKVKGGYEVKSEHGNKNLGKSPTLAGAKKRLKQIEYFKHVKESKLNPADPHTDYREKKKTLQDLSRNKDVDQKVVQQRHLELDKEYSKLNNQGNTYSVMPKFDDIKEEDFYDEIDSLSLLEDILEVYDDNELAIIDSETGEQLDEEGFQEELTEAISRIERMRRRQRWARSKSKREVKEKIALRKTSSVPVLTKRAKRLATLMVKKRILRKDPSSASVQEKERAEKFLHTRPQLIQRLARRLVPRMRQVEKARLHHHKYTQSSVGTGTSASYSAH